MKLRVLLATLLAAALVPSPGLATLANPDCDATDYTLGSGGKLRAASFRYLTGNAPLVAPQASVEAAIRAAALAWTNQINDCGWADTTAIQYELGGTKPGVSGTTANHGNGIPEIFWGCFYACNYLAYAIGDGPNSCDIVLNNNLGTYQALWDRTEYMATVFAHEMGHCVGIDHPPDTARNKVQTVSASYCLSPETPLVGPTLDYWANSDCGLTLAAGDMLAARALHPS